MPSATSAAISIIAARSGATVIGQRRAHRPGQADAGQVDVPELALERPIVGCSSTRHHPLARARRARAAGPPGGRSRRRSGPRSTARTLLPSPSVNRPLDSRSRSSAAIAVSSGLRTNAMAMPDASSSSPHAAAAPSVAHGGPKICGTSTPADAGPGQPLDLARAPSPDVPGDRNAQCRAARTRARGVVDLSCRPRSSPWHAILAAGADRAASGRPGIGPDEPARSTVRREPRRGWGGRWGSSTARWPSSRAAPAARAGPRRRCSGPRGPRSW